MPLQYHPKIGTVVICDYQTGFHPPEMQKRRPVVIISPRLRQRNDLCTVVPLSTTPPNPSCDFHCVLSGLGLPSPYDAQDHWVKADMLATVGFQRLQLPFVGRGSGTRKYVTKIISDEQLAMVKCCVLHALGMKELTVHV